eukprot:TRINITY_DN6092_c0_g1_i2.p1 TRINITY_DN6092_c0_g1~~TRINITY_DN6092_c0_g1_i2.p1  ORF type:complete len:432 (+),score=116.01 TRINITY_DN6092_c0_g1_i2:45-1340(+)
MNKVIFLLAVLVCLGVCDIYNDLVDYNQLKGLPEDLNKKPKLYSGFLSVPNTQKKYHYQFIQSQQNPFADPLILWMNGGPGCSSLYGFLKEHGPFIFPDGQDKLITNRFSWNRVANVLYLESPVGVGFSNSPNPADLITNDNITASDNLAVLLQFFEGFPEYKSNFFYVAGESYAGVYVPLLAYAILNHNKNFPKEQQINLVGILSGNPITDWTLDKEAAEFDYDYYHAFYSDDIRPLIVKYCVPNPLSVQCADVRKQFNKLKNGINLDNIYGYCYPSVQESGSFQYWKKLQAKHLTALNPGAKEIWEELSLVIPCLDIKATVAWLNDDFNQKALHVDGSSTPFELCRDILYSIDFVRGSYYVYPELLKAGLQILVYSGDTDAGVSTLGTLRWIRKLQKETNLLVRKPWSCLLYTSPSPRDRQKSRMPSSA